MMMMMMMMNELRKSVKIWFDDVYRHEFMSFYKKT